MAIGTVEFDLSMVDQETGRRLTARAYTVEGITNADGTLRELSIGQLVMALCLKRAHDLEMGYNDSITGQHVDGVLEIMNSLETNTEILECLTKIETDTLDGDVNLKTKKLTFQGEEMTYYDFLTRQTGVENVPTGTVNSKSTEFISALEAEMDSRNSFSQQTMIQLQSQTTKRDQAYDMISNTLKSLNNVLVGNANNM